MLNNKTIWQALFASLIHFTDDIINNLFSKITQLYILKYTEKQNIKSTRVKMKRNFICSMQSNTGIWSPEESYKVILYTGLYTL